MRVWVGGRGLWGGAVGRMSGPHSHRHMVCHPRQARLHRRAISAGRPASARETPQSRGPSPCNACQPIPVQPMPRAGGRHLLPEAAAGHWLLPCRPPPRQPHPHPGWPAGHPGLWAGDDRGRQHQGGALAGCLAAPGLQQLACSSWPAAAGRPLLAAGLLTPWRCLQQQGDHRRVPVHGPAPMPQPATPLSHPAPPTAPIPLCSTA